MKNVKNAKKQAGKAKTVKSASPVAARGYAARITDKEVERAKKLAARKAGVTRQQLADALKCNLDRAAKILGRSGAASAPLGAGAGKAYRTLVYTMA